MSVGLGPGTRDYAVWVAFVGGFWALAAVTLVNMHRLGMNARAEAPRVIGTAVGGFLLIGAVGVGAVWLWGMDRDLLRRVRFGFQLGAAALALLHTRWQLPAERRYEAVHGWENYGSLWGPGLVAVVLGTALQTVLHANLLIPLMQAMVDESAS